MSTVVKGRPDVTYEWEVAGVDDVTFDSGMGVRTVRPGTIKIRVGGTRGNGCLHVYLEGRRIRQGDGALGGKLQAVFTDMASYGAPISDAPLWVRQLVYTVREWERLREGREITPPPEVFDV